MDEIEVRTVVHVPPEEVFEFLFDFPGYARYTDYLEEVRQHGDGGPGTRYDMVLSWWKITYTVNSEVTAVERPERIEWELVGSLDAEGRWLVEPAPEEAPEGVETATRVRFQAEYRTESVNKAPIDLPSFVSTNWLVRKVKPVVFDELGDIVGRIVTDLEGESRPVDVTVRTGSAEAD